MSPFGSLPASTALASVVAPLALVVYLLLVVDARRKDSPAADDDQLGIKTVCATLIVMGTAMTATGLQKLLHLLLTFSNFGPRLKGAVPDLSIGVLTLVAVLFVLLPKTNVVRHPKAKRLAAGAIAVPTAIMTVTLLTGFLQSVITWSSWSSVADALTSAVVAGLLFAASTLALAKMSGLSVPDISATKPQPDAGLPAQVSHQPAAQPPSAYPPAAQPVAQAPQHPPVHPSQAAAQPMVQQAPPAGHGQPPPGQGQWPR